NAEVITRIQAQLRLESNQTPRTQAAPNAGITEVSQPERSDMTSLQKDAVSAQDTRSSIKRSRSWRESLLKREKRRAANGTGVSDKIRDVHWYEHEKIYCQDEPMASRIEIAESLGIDIAP